MAPGSNGILRRSRCTVDHSTLPPISTLEVMIISTRKFIVCVVIKPDMLKPQQLATLSLFEDTIGLYEVPHVQM